MPDRRLEWTTALVIVAAGALVWLANDPEHPVLERLSAWPVVGGAAAGFRDQFRRPSGPPPNAAAGRDAAEVVVLEVDVPVATTGPPAAPGPHRPDSPSRRAAPPARRGAVDRTPAPPGPLAPRAADPARVLRAVNLIGASGRRSTLGPYALIADFEPPARWHRLAAALDAACEARLGLTPRGAPKETVAVFRDRNRYREFAGAEPQLTGLDPNGHALAGMAVLVTERPDEPGSEALLVHELAHLVHGRAIGPSLPPWLAEGLADDLAWTSFDDRSGFRWGSRRPGVARRGSEIEIRGAAAGLDRLAAALAAGRLPRLADLVVLDDGGFSAGEAPLRYAHAQAFIRFLLDGGDERLRDGLRRFLANVATGGSVGRETLEEALGSGLTGLELRFRADLLARKAAEVDAPIRALALPGETIGPRRPAGDG